MNVRIHPSVYVYLFSMAILSSWKTCAGALTALCVHEFGHFAVSRAAGDRIDRIELTPFGGIMTYADGKSPSKGIKGICIAAAGPAANYLFLILVGTMPVISDYELLRSIVSSNAAMLCVNLLPAFPLDGGRMLFCLGYYVFPILRLISVLSWMGIATGIGFLFLAIYGAMVLGSLNCSVVIVGSYLAYCAWKSRMQMMAENLYAVVLERQEENRNIQALKIYRVTPDVPLIRLVPYLSRACEFVFIDDLGEHRVSEKTLCRSLLEQPLAAIEDIFLQ